MPLITPKTERDSESEARGMYRSRRIALGEPSQREGYIFQFAKGRLPIQRSWPARFHWTVRIEIWYQVWHRFALGAEREFWRCCDEMEAVLLGSCGRSRGSYRLIPISVPAQSLKCWLRRRPGCSRNMILENDLIRNVTWCRHSRKCKLTIFWGAWVEKQRIAYPITWHKPPIGTHAKYQARYW